jgi:predicted Zn-dependent peptidase
MQGDYAKRRLDNGLRIIFVPMPHLHAVLMSLFVGVGPRYESEDERGLSYFVARCLYEGSEANPSRQGLTQAVQDVAGELDQTVYQDHAVFWLRVHANFLEEGIRLLADTIQRPLFAEESLNLVQQIVLRELQQHSLDNPHSLALGLMHPDLPRRMIVPGEAECVEAFGEAAARGHFERFYVPANMVLVFAGRFDQDRAAEAAAESFDRPAAGVDPAVLTPPAWGEFTPGPRWVMRPTAGAHATLLLRHWGMRYQDPGALALNLANALFDSGWRGSGERVFHVDAQLNFTHDFSLLDIHASTTDKNLTHALGAVVAWIDRCAEGGVDEAALRRVRNLARCRMEFILDSPAALSGWVGARALLHPTSHGTLRDEIERVSRVTAEEVQAVMRQVFAPERRYLAVTAPQPRYVRKRRLERLLRHGTADSAEIARKATAALDYASALEAYEEAAVVEPDSAEIHYGLARASCMTGEATRAMATLQTLSRLDGGAGWLKRAAVEPDFDAIRDLPAFRELIATSEE